MGLGEVTQAKGRLFPKMHSTPLLSGRRAVLFFPLTHSSSLTVLANNRGREGGDSRRPWIACLELVPLPCNQKALRGEMRGRSLSVMCCRVSPGPSSLKSFIKKKKKNPSASTKLLSFTYRARKEEKAAAAIRGALPGEPGVRLPPRGSNIYDPLSNPKSIF